MTAENGTTQPLVRVGTPTIQTLSVTVHALRIGPKQVTQSVFRQLPERRVWDPLTGKLQGTPWGRVNYYWGDCSNNHLHVVWDDDEQLFRDCVYHPEHTKPEGVWRLEDTIRQEEEWLARGALFVVALQVWLRGWTLEASTTPKRVTVQWPSGVRTTITAPTDTRGSQYALHNALYYALEERTERSAGHRQYVSEQSNAVSKPPGEGWQEHLPHQNYTPLHHWTRYRLETDSEQQTRRQEALTKAYEALHKALEGELELLGLETFPTTVEGAKEAANPTAEQWQRHCQELDRLRAHFLKTYEQLAALPQLFIAV